MYRIKKPLIRRKLREMSEELKTRGNRTYVKMNQSLIFLFNMLPLCKDMAQRRALNVVQEPLRTICEDTYRSYRKAFLKESSACVKIN